MSVISSSLLKLLKANCVTLLIVIFMDGNIDMPVHTLYFLIKIAIEFSHCYMIMLNYFVMHAQFRESSQHT